MLDPVLEAVASAPLANTSEAERAEMRAAFRIDAERRFWEAVYVAERRAMPLWEPTSSAAHADAALEEWRKRWAK